MLQDSTGFTVLTGNIEATNNLLIKMTVSVTTDVFK